MSDGIAMWLLFVLQLVALGLVLWSARRQGQRDEHRHHVLVPFESEYVVGVDPAGGPDDCKIVVLRRDVDPLWGRNPPPWS